MFVIGTAGHVDHGKSTLVHALTGIDPDRLQEEKERGMTIDLGFAWLTLPSGREVSIVDVPGHERFIKNMLAGVGGIDLALLVVAADEGVMPQTREHLAILDLLHIKSGLVAITKKDLVEKDWLELVLAEVEEVLKGTTLEGAPILAVSAPNRDGLEQLTHQIDALLTHTSPRADLGRPRLPIDRVFTIAGFGTVVTGTLVDGSFAVGQEVEIVPRSLKARIRGLQSHRQKITTAPPGNRVAINLSGVTTSDLERGDVVASPGWLKGTTALDARLRLLRTLPEALAHNSTVTLHTGSSEVVGRVRLLDCNALEPGETGWAQLRLEKPVAVVKGDAFILRSPTRGTLGGGEAVDPFARRHRRFQPALLHHLAVLQQGSPEELLLSLLERWEPCDLKTLVARSDQPRPALEGALERTFREGKLLALGTESAGPQAWGKAGVVLISAEGWQRLQQRALSLVATYHREHRLRLGIPPEELRSRLRLAPKIFEDLLGHLLAENLLVAEQHLLRLSDYAVHLSLDQQQVVAHFLASLEAQPYAPPGDNLPDPELLNLLVEQGKVVKVSEAVVFSSAAYQEMVERVVRELRSRGRITVAEVRDLFNTSRKYALALMEHLDERKITRRVGDERVLR